jgi:ribose/xylose/arabinose/galactoside ABC-type transport system permease subunit
MTTESIDARPGFWSSLAKRLPFRIESLLVLLLLTTFMAVAAPNFTRVSNILNIFLATSVIGILAVGATFVIVSAGLDLSIGSQLALTGVTAGVVLQAGVPWPIGILAALGAGALVGLVNGLLVTKARIPAFIVTLGMLSTARGLALIVSDGRPIYGFPDPITWIGQARPFGVPVPVVVFLLVVLLFNFVLNHTPFGKHTLAIGDNETAARVTGIAIDRHKVLLYMLSGVLAGVAGMLFLGRLNAADPTAGVMYELNAITAAIIGGTNLFGGRGTVVGTLIGALIIGVLQNGLNLLAVPSFYQQVSIGTVLILAVWLDRIRDAGGR